MRITLIGGPTALLEVNGLRLLTDPTFDAAGCEYGRWPVVLRKTAGPACAPEDLEPIDAILLSHDQHADNLDTSGRAFLSHARSVFTTLAAAKRLEVTATGLSPWQTVSFTAENGNAIEITATPARHGPPGIEPVTGDVTGFIVTPSGKPEDAVYITGDTVWYDGVAEVAQRYPVRSVILFAGAACVKLRGPFHLTMNTKDAIATARAFPQAHIYPVHHQGWEHFTENQQDLVAAFAAAGLSERLHPLELGVPVKLVCSAS
jgi:L-ascorbate metabolism protein UlaG (beta-lactamase superfamily)